MESMGEFVEYPGRYGSKRTLFKFIMTRAVLFLDSQGKKSYYSL